MDTVHIQENRKHNRFPIRGKLLVEIKKDFKCTDIGEGGLYIATGNIFEENSFFEITIPYKGKNLKVKAQIRHFEPGIGAGLEFIELTEEQSASIKEMVDSMEHELETAKGEKILLIEDHDMSRKINEITLQEAGYILLGARSGAEGIKMLREHTPDLIILDLNMDVMDGFKVLSILKASPKWMNIPILVFSSSITQDIIDKLIRGGADEFLLKTETSPAKLIETVRLLLHRKMKG